MEATRQDGDVSLRPLRAEDVDDAVSIGTRAFESAAIGKSIGATLDLYFRSGLAGVPIGDQHSEALPREYFAILATGGGKPSVIGITGLYALGTWTWPGNLWLGWTAIDPDHQSSGIGSAMLGLVMSVALSRGAVRLKVETEHGGRAVAFYLRNGFRPEAVLRDHYGPGIDADVLAHELAPLN